MFPVTSRRNTTSSCGKKSTLRSEMLKADFSFLKEKNSQNLCPKRKFLGRWIEGFVPLSNLRGADRLLTYFILRDKGRYGFFHLSVPSQHIYKLSCSFLLCIFSLWQQRCSRESLSDGLGSAKNISKCDRSISPIFK